MTTFLKFLLWLFLVVCMVTPVSIALSFSIGTPVSTILSAVWGFACGFVATKLVL